MSEWDVTVKEWLIDKGAAVAGALCNPDGKMFAAAAGGDDNGWDYMWSEDTMRPVFQEDGTEKDELVVEAEVINQVITSGRAPRGLYVGGKKYRPIKMERDFDYNDASYAVLDCAREGGGLVMIKTHGGTIILGVFITEQGQNAGLIKGAMLPFAEQLNNMGY